MERLLVQDRAREKHSVDATEPRGKKEEAQEEEYMDRPLGCGFPGVQSGPLCHLGTQQDAFHLYTVVHHRQRDRSAYHRGDNGVALARASAGYRRLLHVCKTDLG